MKTDEKMYQYLRDKGLDSEACVLEYLILNVDVEKREDAVKEYSKILRENSDNFIKMLSEKVKEIENK